MRHTLDAVVLDAGNTLVFVDPVRTGDILHRHGAVRDARRFAEVEREARIRLASRRDEGATGTEEQFWRDYFVTLYAGMSLPEHAWGPATEELKAVHAEDHLWTHVDRSTRETLERLLALGYRLAVVSNADGRVEALLERVGLADCFEFIIDSEVVGIEKPDRRIFELALDRLRVEPDRALYVGDLYPVDVLGARSAGMRTVLLDPFDRFGHLDDVARIPTVDRLPDFLETC